MRGNLRVSIGLCALVDGVTEIVLRIFVVSKIKHESNSRLGIAAAAYAVTVWGYGNVLVRDIPLAGSEVAALRLWLGAGLAIVLLYVTGRKLSLRAFYVGLGGGISFGLNSTLFFTAVKYTSPTTATIIGALQPALLLMVVGKLFGERVTRSSILASFVALVGTVVVVLGAPKSGHDSLFGDLLAVGALIAYCTYFVFSKKARESLGTFEYQASMQLSAAIVVTPIALLTNGTSAVSLSDMFLILVLTVIPGGGHFFMNWAHNKISLSIASLLTLATPVATMIFAKVMLNQSVTLLQVVGTAIVLGALSVLVLRAPKLDVAVAD